MATVDQTIMLQRSPVLSRAIVAGIIGVTSFSLLWASVAQLEEAIPATGKLAPQGTVQEIKAPLNGVVKHIYVREGQRVKQGDILLTLDSTTSQAQLTSLQTIQAALKQENAFYRAVLQNAGTPAARTLNLTPEVAALTQNRSTLIAENQLYRAQVGATNGVGLNVEQSLRLRSHQAEVSSRHATAALEVAQLKQQLAQNRVQLASAQDLLAVNQTIYKDLEPVTQEGGLSRLQFLKQQQEVRTRQGDVDELIQEQQRLQLAIEQGQQKFNNAVAVSSQDVLTKLADNEKQLAVIDSQLNKTIVENEKRLAEIGSQLSETQGKLNDQALRAPVDGTVFDLKASSPGFVANSTEPILKVVPNNSLIVDVLITNKDIGFVKEGMPVDIRVDTFPFSEFGDVKGKLLSIGSDALPPTQLRPSYSFPAKVQLDRQALTVNGRELPLQSGMSVSVNIKVRDRSIMSLFTDGFVKGLESLKFVR
ncbi:MAG: HlyD family efflux transporter periplasmic adaptor subunit [Tildeniella nuda ZEHNDER 1965/U140]|nr:HlyD family efflux transporter periplasmic adaptor subunit [Tildeniella nuda ZEHNDER 1965/U140]